MLAGLVTTAPRNARTCAASEQQSQALAGVCGSLTCLKLSSCREYVVVRATLVYQLVSKKITPVCFHGPVCWLVQAEDPGIPAREFIKLFVSSLKDRASVRMQPSGALLLHLQYLPKTTMDVSDEFLLLPTVSDVPAQMSTFVFNVLEQLEGVDGAWRVVKCGHARIAIMVCGLVTLVQNGTPACQLKCPSYKQSCPQCLRKQAALCLGSD
jgi:hypothetical protein